MVLSALAIAPGASAASFAVNDTTDAALGNPAATTCASTHGATCTLRAAVQAADNTGGSSTITLPAGDYKLTIPSTAADDPTNGDLDVKGSLTAVTITGAGASGTTIDANQIDRAFAIDSGDALSLSGVTITNGDPAGTSTTTTNRLGGDVYSDGTLRVSSTSLENTTAASGGAIYNHSGALTLVDDTLANVEASYGAGVYVGGGSLIDTGSTFDGLAAAQVGGAVYASGTAASAALTNSTFIDDSAGDGGAIGINDGSLSVTGATFTNDFAAENQGGGIYYHASGGNFSVSHSLFSGDSASSGSGTAEGGAIFSDAGTGSIDGTHFTGNGSSHGGAIYSDGTGLTVSGSRFDHDNGEYGGGLYAAGGTLSVTQSTFDHESASLDAGGGLYIGTGGAVTIANTTLSDDRASEGGGVYVNSGAPSFVNDTIAGNQALNGEGGGLHAPESASGIQNTIVADNSGGDCDASAGSADKGNNLDSDGSCFTGTGAPGDKMGVDPQLGPLQDDGGPGPTQDPLSGSPAIDGGQDAACNAAPTSGVDERGVTRPQGPHCDIGAVEATTADVAISQTAPSIATEGTPITYTLNVSNNGPGPAGNVTVTDTLPGGTTYLDSAPSQGSCTGTSTVTCSLGSVGPGAGATVAITVVAGSPGSITNIATVAASQPDPNTANNTASATTTVTAGPTVTTFTPPLALTGAASQITASGAKLSAIINPAGQTTTYSVQLGTGTKYGTNVKGGTLAATTTAKGVVIAVKSLKPATEYHFRIVATNATGTSDGQDATFKTPKGTPQSLTLVTGHKGHRYKFGGRLGLPANVKASSGCRGTVTVTVKHGAKIAATIKTKLNRKCVYLGTTQLTGPSKLGTPQPTGPSKFKVTAKFGGNPVLKARSAPPLMIFLLG